MQRALIFYTSMLTIVDLIVKYVRSGKAIQMKLASFGVALLKKGGKASMKMKVRRIMKRTVWIIIAVTMILSLISVSAYADYSQAEYSSTKQFLKALDDIDIKYTWQGIDSDEYEMISINNNSDVMGNYNIYVFFDENNHNCGMRVWNVIDYNNTMSSSVYDAVNSINKTYKYVKLYADDTDNSVTASIDLIYRDSNVDEICLEAMFYIVSVIDDAYPVLKPFDK